MFKMIIYSGAILVIMMGGCSPEKESLPTWETAGLKSKEYMTAAHTALVKLQEEGHWLSLGEVIKLIGLPTSMHFMPYYFDESHNVMWKMPRFSIFYKKRGVYVIFSANGLVESVVYVVDQNKRKGLGSFEWPQSLEEANLPVIIKQFELDSDVKQLLEGARSFAKKNSLESDWYLLMFNNGNSELSDRYRVPCNSRVVLVDGLGNGMARVHYWIEGKKHTLYCDTWWRKTRGKWERISENSASQLISRN